MFAGPKTLMLHMRRHHSGVPKAATKVNELNVHQALQKAGVIFEYQKYIPFAGSGLNSETRCAYLDFVITKDRGHLVVECNELQHKHYD